MEDEQLSSKLTQERSHLVFSRRCSQAWFMWSLLRIDKAALTAAHQARKTKIHLLDDIRTTWEHSTTLLLESPARKQARFAAIELAQSGRIKKTDRLLARASSQDDKRILKELIRSYQIYENAYAAAEQKEQMLEQAFQKQFHRNSTALFEFSNTILFQKHLLFSSHTFLERLPDYWALQTADLQNKKWRKYRRKLLLYAMRMMTDPTPLAFAAGISQASKNCVLHLNAWYSRNDPPTSWNLNNSIHTIGEWMRWWHFADEELAPISMMKAEILIAIRQHWELKEFSLSEMIDWLKEQTDTNEEKCITFVEQLQAIGFITSAKHSYTHRPILNQIRDELAAATNYKAVNQLSTLIKDAFPKQPASEICYADCAFANNSASSKPSENELSLLRKVASYQPWWTTQHVFQLFMRQLFEDQTKMSLSDAYQGWLAADCPGKYSESLPDFDLRTHKQSTNRIDVQRPAIDSVSSIPVSALVQPTQSNKLWLKALSPGGGRLLGRHSWLLTDAEWQKWRKLYARDTSSIIEAELLDETILNEDFSRPLLPFSLSLSLHKTDREPAKSIRLADISLTKAQHVGGTQLWHKKRRKPIWLYATGSGRQHSLLFEFLLLCAQRRPSHYKLHQQLCALHQAKHDSHTFMPAVFVDQTPLMLLPPAWSFRADQLPLLQKGESDFQAFQRIQRWREEMGLPLQCICHNSLYRTQLLIDFQLPELVFLWKKYVAPARRIQLQPYYAPTSKYAQEWIYEWG